MNFLSHFWMIMWLTIILFPASHKKQPASDGGLRDLSHLTEAEQVEYLIQMTQEEARLDLQAGFDYTPAG